MNKENKVGDVKISNSNSLKESHINIIKSLQEAIVQAEIHNKPRLAETYTKQLKSLQESMWSDKFKPDALTKVLKELSRRGANQEELDNYIYQRKLGRNFGIDENKLDELLLSGKSIDDIAEYVYNNSNKKEYSDMYPRDKEVIGEEHIKQPKFDVGDEVIFENTSGWIITHRWKDFGVFVYQLEKEGSRKRNAAEYELKNISDILDESYNNTLDYEDERELIKDLIDKANLTLLKEIIEEYDGTEDTEFLDWVKTELYKNNKDYETATEEDLRPYIYEIDTFYLMDNYVDESDIADKELEQERFNREERDHVQDLENYWRLTRL